MHRAKRSVVNYGETGPKKPHPRLSTFVLESFPFPVQRALAMGACAREAVDLAKKASNQSIHLPDAAQQDVRRGHGTSGEPTKLYLGRTLYPALGCVCARARMCAWVCGSVFVDVSVCLCLSHVNNEPLGSYLTISLK